MKHYLWDPNGRDFVPLGEFERQPLEREGEGPTAPRLRPRIGLVLDPPDLPLAAAIAAAILFAVLAAGVVVVVGGAVGLMWWWTGGGR